MTKHKSRKKDDSGYSFVYAQVTKYTVAVDSSVNHEARDDRWCGQYVDNPSCGQFPAYQGNNKEIFNSQAGLSTAAM
jgi:hypothetical protein